MSATAIEIRPLSGSLGAEIHGIDLARPLDAETFERVERAFLDHPVLFFRDQELAPAPQRAFAAALARLASPPRRWPMLSGSPPSTFRHPRSA